MKNIAYSVLSAIALLSHVTHANQAAIDDFRTLVSQCRRPAGEVVRIAFHEPGTYRVSDGKGGNDGSLRLTPEVNAPENKGLSDAILQLEMIAKKHGISFADAVVASGIVAIEECGGPKGMPITFGRIDTDTPNDPTRLPGARVTAQQIRDAFITGMGFTVEETVALIGGGHTVGHIRNPPPNAPAGPFDTTPEKWDTLFFQQLLQPAAPNGVARIPADLNMANDPEMRAAIDRFIQLPEQFSKVFAAAYVKLLNLGSKFKNQSSTSVSTSTSSTIYTTHSTAFSTTSSYNVSASYTTLTPSTTVPNTSQYQTPTYSPGNPPKNRTYTNNTGTDDDYSSQANPLILAGTLMYTFLLSFAMTSIF